MLVPYGRGESTLVTTSFCCDEVNREDFGAVYGDSFFIGCLAGFPFDEVTAFRTMAYHRDAVVLVIYRPHIGVDVGKANRRGRDKSGTCCGSTATQRVADVLNDEVVPQYYGISTDSYCTCLTNVCQQLNLPLPQWRGCLDADDASMVERAAACYLRYSIPDYGSNSCQRERLPAGKNALLGGVQKSTPQTPNSTSSFCL